MDNAPKATLCVLGAGSWGTALAMLLARNGHRVTLWDRADEHIENLLRNGSNQQYLPDIPFPKNLTPVTDLQGALTSVDYVLVAVPSVGFRSILKRIQPQIETGCRLIWATKGLEPGKGGFLHQVFEEEISSKLPYALLSGPSFAIEVAQDLPTAVTIASRDLAYATEIAALFHGPRFRAYTSNDVIGVELGGAIKNVLAIAAGISDGMGFGANARAALITRGLAEIIRLGVELGGKRETFMGLTGVGDLVLTCTDDKSRNRRLGLALGKGIPLQQAVDDIGQAVEGLHTARELDDLAHKSGVDLPITHQVKKILFDNVNVTNAVVDLLMRDAKNEHS